MLNVARAAELRSMPEHEVQALYLYNFTKYVDWPASAFSSGESPFVIGLVGREEVRQDLEEIARAKTVSGRPVVIRLVAAEAEFTKCHMLFIGSGSRKDIEHALQVVSKRPILTVGVTEEFLNLGGMILLTRRENRLDLRINLEASRKAQLNVSAKLMIIAERAQANSVRLTN
jgi:hypothetical protein